MRETSITFFSESIPLVGIISFPDIPVQKNPAIILAHGYANSKGEFGGFDEMAHILNNAGFLVLRFDFRGCGESGGVKGRMLCTTEWPVDLMNAVTYMLSRNDVARNKIAIIGQSMGAVTAVYNSAFDDRIAFIIAMGGFSDGKKWLEDIWIKSSSHEKWQEFQQKIIEDRITRVTTGKSRIIPIPDIFNLDKKSREYWVEMKQKYPYFIVEAPLESIDSIMNFRPIDVVNKNKCPILFIHGEKDLLVSSSNASDLYKKATKPKEIVIIPNAGHDLPTGEFKSQVHHEILNGLTKFLG